MKARARHIGLLGLLASVAVVTAADAVASRTFWVQAFPADNAEIALRDAATRVAGRPPTEVAAAYAGIAAAHEGTTAAGLAALGAGLVLLDAGKHGDALPHLRNDDLSRTPLRDHALLARGRAHEVLQQPQEAIDAYLAAADAIPRGTLVCTSLFRAAEVQKVQGRLDDAVTVIRSAYERCDTQRARALLLLGYIHEQRKDVTAAAVHYRRVEDEHPATLQAVEAARQLTALRPQLTPEDPAVRTARELQRALAVFEAGRHADAYPLLRALVPRVGALDRDVVNVRIARSLMAMNKLKEAGLALGQVAAGTPHAAELQFTRARLLAARDRDPVAAYQAVVDRFAGTTWAEQALNNIALHYQKDARHDAALPYYRLLLARFPDGEYADRAAWYAGWGDYRHSRFKEAAEALERLGRTRPPSSYTGAGLYWGGRARQRLGQTAQARVDFEEAVVRYKHAYHGILARQALQRMEGGVAAESASLSPGATEDEIPTPTHDRLRALLLIDRLEEALDELKTLPRSPRVNATISWIEWRRGNLRPAITWMKRAYPEHVSAAGDRLPENVWRILYPLEHADSLLTSALAEGLDPALVAALVCQESTFQDDALSAVGARGLMQLMPPTARELARKVGIRAPSLLDPDTNLRLGSRYLRELVNRYGGRVERALAAYNAGPTRVYRWTSARPDMSLEEFVETIPFQETRGYVMTILTSREQYRWIYGLQKPRGAGAGAAP